MRNVFFNPAEKRLRALWRLLLQALLAVVMAGLPVVLIFGLWNLSGPQTILPAIVLSSCAFGALHLVNTGVTLLGAINISVVGVLYATAFVITRQLGMSIGLHMAWNVTQGLLLGFPSGDSNEPASVVNMTLSGPSWITGGSSGPEAGLLAPFSALLGTALLLMLHKNNNWRVRQDSNLQPSDPKSEALSN